MSHESALRIVWIYPDLLSTYGDRGNVLILARRARHRNIQVDVTEVRSDESVPAQADIYLLGGGEDGPQAVASERLRSDGGVARAVARGAVVFGVCAGYQILGTSFFAKGEKCAGLGVLDVFSERGRARAVGELVATSSSSLSMPTLTGFENHGGRTQVGAGAKPLGSVVRGIGNDESTEGAWSDRILGTYMHGPALARNPMLADVLLSWAVGRNVEPLPHPWADALRAERLR